MTQNVLTAFLRELGLSPEEITLYLALKDSGASSTVGLARQTTIARTTIYRLLDHLVGMGLVEEMVVEKKSVFQITPPEKILALIKHQKERFVNLESDFSTIAKLLSQGEAELAPGTQVRYFRGPAGIEQMEWNSFNASELCSYFFLTYDEIFGKTKAQELREEIVLRGQRIRSLLSDDDRYLNKKTLDFIKKSPLFKPFEFRYLPAGQVKISQTMYIYDNTVAMYNWYRGEIAGVEIHNGTFAQLQRQIFNLLWDQAKTPDQVLASREKN